MLRVLIHVGIFLASVFAIIWLYFQRKYDYWKKRNIPFEKPTFPFGSIKSTTKKTFGVVLRDIYEKTKSERFVGLWIFYKPILLINDPDLVKDILVKNFMSFQDHGVYYDEKVDPLSAHLFAIEGSKWRNIRAKLTPTFTSGKMKMMFPIVKNCSDELRDALRREEGVVEVKEFVARYTTDVIASCAFGIEANSLKNPNAMFRVMGRKLFEPTWDMYMRNFTTFLVPSLGKLFKIRATPKKIADFFIGAFKDTIKYRESNEVKRNDFLQLLMELMNKGFVEDADYRNGAVADKTGFTFNDAVAEAFIFFIGGFETSSTTLNFLLYHLAMNQDIQDRLRNEIENEVMKSNGEITYEGMTNMEYMGRVIQETLRLHPPATLLNRVCTKPYKIPETDIVLEKDTSVFIPNYGFHLDEKYFPNPEKFHPDRFLENSMNQFTYLPFGEGPRVCIGQRFAMMQIRLAVSSILSNFKVTPAEGKTPSSIDYDPMLFILTPTGGMHLRFQSIR